MLLHARVSRINPIHASVSHKWLTSISERVNEKKSPLRGATLLSAPLLLLLSLRDH
jgi:hypothetical protein